MTYTQLKREAKEHFEARDTYRKTIIEIGLSLADSVQDYVDSRPGSLRSKAAKAGIPVGHLSEVMRGNRGVTMELINKLGRME